jgi:hypothetical protein
MTYKNPHVTKVGSLEIPVSQWKLGQALQWIQNRGYENGEECPLDVSVLPTRTLASVLDSKDAEGAFYTFREIKIGEATEASLPEIIMVFDRLQVTSQALSEESATFFNLEPQHLQGIARDTQIILKDEHGIVINLRFLTEALGRQSIYSEVRSVEELVARILENISETPLLSAHEVL